MTDQKDYRLYLEEKFATLTMLIEANHKEDQLMIEVNHKEDQEALERIESHVLETNGRVTKLETRSIKGEEVVKEFHEFRNKFAIIKKRWVWFLLGAITFVTIITFLYDIGALTKVITSIFDKAVTI